MVHDAVSSSCPLSSPARTVAQFHQTAASLASKSRDAAQRRLLPTAPPGGNVGCRRVLEAGPTPRPRTDSGPPDRDPGQLTPRGRGIGPPPPRRRRSEA